MTIEKLYERSGSDEKMLDHEKTLDLPQKRNTEKRATEHGTQADDQRKKENQENVSINLAHSRSFRPASKEFHLISDLYALNPPALANLKMGLV